MLIRKKGSTLGGDDGIIGAGLGGFYNTSKLRNAMRTMTKRITMKSLERHRPKRAL
jgi:hypothetical protein